MKKILNKLKRIWNSEQIIFRTFIITSLFFLVFIILNRLILVGNEFFNIILILSATLVLVLIALNTIEFFVKIKNNSNPVNFSLYFYINTLLGIIIPLSFFNLVLSSLISIFAKLPNLGTLLCDLRNGLVEFYRTNGIYNEFSNIFWQLLLISTLLFFFGNFIEKVVIYQKRK